MANPNHDDQGRFSSGHLREQIKSAMSYSQAKEVKEKLSEQVAAHSQTLKALSGGGNMGMTPDSVKATPEWQLAKANYDKSSGLEREHNTLFLKKYSKEYAADRASRRGR